MILPAKDRPLAELDDYLQRREDRFSDIRDGCEKKIIWHDGQVRRPLAIVYLHGFSASRAELSPVCETVASHLQANLFFTRLAGHGLDGSALAETSVNDWFNDTCEALAIGQRLGHRLIVIGNSTGATLATWLALSRPSAVSAYVLLSPNFAVRHRLEPLFRLPLAWLVPSLLSSTYYGGDLTTPAQEQCWTNNYPLLALGPMLELVHTIARSDLSRIVSPVLMLVNKNDAVVKTRTTIKLAKQLTGYQQIEVIDCDDPQHHILAGDLVAPRNNDLVTTTILRFIEQQLDFLKMTS